MKKIYTIIGATALMFASFAQETIISKPIKLGTPYLDGSMTKPVKMLNKTTLAVAGDTAGWQNFVDFLPEFAPSGNLSIFGYLGGGYCYGKNVDSIDVCAAGFLNVNNTNIVVSKVILFAARKKGTGPAGSVITVKFYDMAANKANHYNSTTMTSTMDAVGPNTLKGTATVPFSMIDTSSVLPTSPWTIVTFPTPMTTNKGFAIGVDCTTLAPGDTVGFVSDKKNDAAGADLTFHRGWGGGTSFTAWYVTDGGMFAEGGLDNNVGFFAIMAAGTAVNEYVNGAKLNAIYPNPSTDNATIEYSLEKASDKVSLSVYDVRGQKVYDENFGSQNAGTYKVNINSSSYEAGTYFYQLTSNGHAITKELVIVK